MKNDYHRYDLESVRGERECLKCRKRFMSPDVIRVRMCEGCHKTNLSVSSIVEVFGSDIRRAAHHSKAG
jgi:Zn finger protein HypA/HybF involved in hydrogenase expression